MLFQGRQLQELRDNLDTHQANTPPPLCTQTDYYGRPPDTSMSFKKTKDEATLMDKQPPGRAALSKTSSPLHNQPPDTQTPHSQPPDGSAMLTQTADSRPKVVLLMDSNRKFLDPKKLFPQHQVHLKNCSTSKQVLQMLETKTLGNPQVIIVHTGTNDLHSLHRGTAEAVCNVAVKASSMFPDTRVVISALLPRYDTPPHIINAINADIFRGCTALPNVHMAHHPTISPRDMYDGIHLHKDRVGAFAKSLKDCALDRNPHTIINAPLWHRPPLSPNCRPQHAPVYHGRTTTHTRSPKHKASTTPARNPALKERPQSYAAAAAQPVGPGPTSHKATELDEIKNILQLLCSRLLGDS